MVAGILPVAAIAERIAVAPSDLPEKSDIPTSGWSEVISAKTVNGYRKVSSLDALVGTSDPYTGNYYMFLSSGAEGSAYALTLDTSKSYNISKSSFRVAPCSDGIPGLWVYSSSSESAPFSETSNKSVWKTSSYNDKFRIHNSSGSYYLHYQREYTWWGDYYDYLAASSGSASSFVNNRSMILNSSISSYLAYNDNSFVYSESPSNPVSIFRYTTVNIPAVYAALSGQTEFYVHKNTETSEEDMKTAIGDKIKVWLSKSSDSAHSDAVLTNDFKITGLISADSVGDKTLTIKYKDGIVGSVTVHVIDADPEKAIVSVTPTSGRILVRSGIDASTGSTMTITHASGKEEIVPVTFGMITKKNGEPCNQNTTEGLYEGCSVTYISIDGYRFGWGYDDSADNYTLEVYSNDYPEYPEKGSVILDKNAYDIANVPWYSSGLANVELSVKGIPSERGVDMIVIMDTSGSMNTSISTSTDVTRLDVAKESLINLIQILCADDASGKSKDVQIAIADFNDQTRNPSSSFSFESNNMFGNDTSMDSYPFEEYCPGRLFTGPNAGKAYAEANGYFDASAFVDVQSLSTWTVDNLASMTAGGGTNYDAGLGYALMLARAKQVQNASNGEQRDMVIIFMSDGTPHQYNFFVKAYNQDSSDSTASWTDWIRFTDPDTNGTIYLNSGSNTLYMNTANNYRHFYAEALKGAANAQYSIVDMSKNIVGLDTKHIVGDDNMYNINGIGAKLYTIGFALANYGNYGPTATQQASILRGLASEGCFFQAKDASELNEAFDAIAGQTLTAAKYSYFIDTVGDDFDLQTSNHFVDETGISQKIEVKRYRVVKYSDIGKTLKIGGVSVEITNVNITEYLGKRIDDAVEVIETVTFSADGTQAFSDQILDANGEPINIIDENNIICAKYFRFNLNSESKDVVVPVLNPKTEITDQPDLDHPYVMKSYSFSTDPINDGSGWTREGGGSSTWQYDSTDDLMYSEDGSNPAKFISPEFTVPAAGGRFQIQLSNEDYNSSGSGNYTTLIKIYIRNSSGTDTLIMNINHPFDAGYRDFTNYFVDMVGTDADGQSYDFRKQTIKMVIERPAYSDYGATADDAVFCGYNFKSAATGATKHYNLPAKTFYWITGDITEDELALSYNVYLKDSVDPQTGAPGSCPDGIYPTNEGNATVYYTNYLESDCHKDIISPLRPWGKAAVSIGFYFVDSDNGLPVINLSTGVTGTFANMIPAREAEIYTQFVRGGNATITHSTIKSMADNAGFELYDNEASYSVTVGETSGGSWSIGGGNTTYVTGFGYGYSNESNNSDADDDYSNTTVWIAVKYKVGATADAVVLDYGLPVSINVLDNDLLSMVANKKIVGIGFASKMPAGQTTDLDANFVLNENGLMTGDFGTAKVADANRGIITYTLDDSNSMNFNAPETLAYAVQCLKGFDDQGNKEYTYYYATLTIIPAAIVYYEDNFITFDDNWGTYGSDPGAHQAQDRPGAGSNPLLDQNNPYGYDPAYAGCLQYSMGSSHSVTVDWDNMSEETAATASFTFSGTGFDIIGKTDSTSGTLVIQVYEYKASGNYEGSAPVRSLIVDTYYGYTYVGGVWKPNQNPSNAAVWQVPVMKVEDLDYDHYYVKLLAMYHPYLDHNEDGQYTLYIDAVRIYDPAMNNETAKNAYALDGEANPDYQTVRHFVFNQMASAPQIEGFAGGVFIDGAGGVNYGVNDSGEFLYTNPSPNNEIYLAPGQAVYFKLRANVDPTNERVMIGIKLAFGSSASLTLTQLDSAGNKISTDTIATVKTATDMYYSLGNITWKPVTGTTYYETNGLVLANTVSAGDVISNVISLTNLKISSYDTSVDINFADINAASDVNELLAGDSALIVPCCDSDEAIAAAEYMNYNYGSYTLGDVNGDGEIDMLDTLITLRHTIGLAELWGAKRRAADMDGNGVIDAIDVMHIMRYVMENK